MSFDLNDTRTDSSELGQVINSGAALSQHADTILTEEIEARMKLPSTAVLLFFIEADEFSTVEDIISMVQQYKRIPKRICPGPCWRIIYLPTIEKFSGVLLWVNGNVLISILT